jgi:putative inorganic carbon (HCO3(-)) transporter
MREENPTTGMFGFIARYELLIVLAVAPLLLFPGRATPVAVVVIGLVWLARRITTGRLTRPSAMNWPQILLVVMAIIGYLVSVDRQLSEPKLWGIVLQAALFFAALNGLRARRHVAWLAAGIVSLTAAVALISLVGTQWDVVRLASLPLYDRLPQLLRNIPDSGLSPGQEFFHPREVGATMGMLLPFVTAIMLFGSPRWLRLAAVPVLLLGGFVLMLSQALMGLFGLLVGWAIIALWWRRWTIIPIALLVVGLVILGVSAAPADWPAWLFSLDNPIGAGVLLRLDMWSRAVAMIADMPYTGVGLNTYPLIQTHFYIGYLLGPEPHAHNLLLQTAVDLGLPGLIGLLWLLGAFYLTAWRVGRQLADRPLQAVLIGAVAGVTAYVAGGALDVMTLGAKPVAALSLFLGLVGALHWLSQPMPLTDQATVPPRLRLAGLVAPGLLLLALVISVALRPAAVLTNQALIPAHQTIYAARQLGRLPPTPAAQAAAWLPQAIARDPQNAELHAVYGSLLAWEEQPQAALDALVQRVVSDVRRPYAYAPFLPYQHELAGEPPESEWQALLSIYRQWQIRFPERAENQALVALVHERGLQNSQAATLLDNAIAAGALPRSLLELYRSQQAP